MIPKLSAVAFTAVTALIVAVIFTPGCAGRPAQQAQVPPLPHIRHVAAIEFESIRNDGYGWNALVFRSGAAYLQQGYAAMDSVTLLPEATEELWRAIGKFQDSLAWIPAVVDSDSARFTLFDQGSGEIRWYWDERIEPNYGLTNQSNPKEAQATLNAIHGWTTLKVTLSRAFKGAAPRTGGIERTEERFLQFSEHVSEVRARAEREVNGSDEGEEVEVSTAGASPLGAALQAEITIRNTDAQQRDFTCYVLVRAQAQNGNEIGVVVGPRTAPVTVGPGDIATIPVHVPWALIQPWIGATEFIEFDVVVTRVHDTRRWFKQRVVFVRDVP